EPLSSSRAGERPPRSSSSRGAYSRRMGADVRLILPGDGCLLCHGGLAHYREALETLTSGREAAKASGLSGRHDRTGSLRSLNQLAASVGMSLLLDLAAERVTGSRWTQLERDDTGRLNLSETQGGAPSQTSDCPVCIRAGRGDDPIEAI